MGFDRPRQLRKTLVLSVSKSDADQIKKDLRTLVVSGLQDFIIAEPTQDFLTEVFLKLKEDD